MYDTVNVLAELERFVVHYEFAGSDEVRIRCPFHSPDDTPSCSINTQKRVFICGSCKSHGDIITLLAKIAGHARAVILEDLSTRYELDEAKIVEQSVIEQWHDAIWSAGVLLQELHDRAITDKIIRERKLGCDGSRITIPVFNERGHVVNVRKYLPGAPGKDKMKNMRGRGAARLYPVDQLKYDMVCLCGGEMKALAAAEQLNPRGIGAICATQGEQLLPPELLFKLRGKSVPVIFDIDSAGRAAADLNCRALKSLATEIFDIVLPLDIDKFPKGDINDFIFHGGELWPLIEAAELWVPVEKKNYDDSGEPELINLSAAANARYAGKRIAVNGIVTAMDTAPYSVPKDIVANCDKSMGPMCSLCPVFSATENKFTVPIESPAILEVVASPKRVVQDALMGAIGVPRMCRVVQFDVESYYNCEDTRLTPQLEITNRAADQKMQPAICIGNGLDLNEPYKLVGRMYPHPQTQQATLLISSYEASRDALSTYECRDLPALDIFRPDAWSVDSIESKLKSIYDDFATCITGVFQRQNLHLAIDLMYHSPLLLNMSDRVENGWTQILVVGDSSQGKSEAVKHLINYYQLGERVECKNATRAGILGGLQQHGNGRWIISWGFLPRHDRRALIFDEIKGMHRNEIGQLTDVRSSGIAELSKIEKQRTYARTRQLWMSNPRPDNMSISSYNVGMECIPELIGGLEDVRRFDMCMIVAKEEVDAAVINDFIAKRNGAHSKYTSELCRNLILWAWTRDYGWIDKETTQFILLQATELCRKFHESIPIVDSGSMRLKLARLSAALAARTFSTNDDRTQLVVRRCHVEYMVRFLEQIYSTRAFGYKQYSDAINHAHKLIDPKEIQDKLSTLPFPYEFLDNILRTEKIELQDLQDWCGSERIEANGLLSVLVRKHALRREGRYYRKTPLFIEFLRKMQDEKLLPEMPSFLKKGEF